MSQPELSQSEVQILQEALNSDHININIRLREGEHQYTLAKTIASFEIELSFPNVKDIIKKSYGEEKVNDIRFIRKIQTILKKMEKSNIVTILPKKKPWDLQKYALRSFKFQDVDKNNVVFVTEKQIRKMRKYLNLLNKVKDTNDLAFLKIKIFALLVTIVASYLVCIWTLTLPIVNPVIFISAFSTSVACSLFLGKLLTKQ